MEGVLGMNNHAKHLNSHHFISHLKSRPKSDLLAWFQEQFSDSKWLSNFDSDVIQIEFTWLSIQDDFNNNAFYEWQR